MKKFTSFCCVVVLILSLFTNVQAQTVLDDVNPFVGTDNYGTTHPGPVCPNGLMSVAPFNVMGSEENMFDKDARWWSTPYSHSNRFFTGFSHVNLSGVGCPEVGSLLLMATTGELEVDYHRYGSRYSDEQASPGYYSNRLEKYNILNEVSATRRTSIARFTFPEGKAHLLMNLGEGLTNESGAWMRRISETEVEGMKLLGTFCYNPQAVFPIYFVMKVNRVPATTGYWKKQRPMQGVEAEWDHDHGRYKRYTKYQRDIAGDDIGAFFSYDVEEGDVLEVQIGVSFVSTDNARLNLEQEQPTCDFDRVHAAARREWEEALSRIQIEGGTKEQRAVFYTGLYHALIHPNVLQDVNGEYPQMEGAANLKSTHDRYTVFSLWDTYRNVHQLLTLLYPEKQLDMVRTMVSMYEESGWLPKWELYGRETLTMDGDPAIPVIVDTWMKGLRDFDMTTAYQAMRKSAFAPGSENLLRPDNDDYMQLGYVSLREKYDNSVSHALEYYVADHALAKMADALGKKEDARQLYRRALGYKKYYDPSFGTFRPLLPEGSFYAPFNPKQGENFESVPGFHEGSAWNYTFFVPHDIGGLIKLMGGKRAFVQKLQGVFDQGLYDPTNEPDIAYPYLFSQVKGEEWRTQQLVKSLLATHFKNTSDGLPGNDDTGAMSSWALFSMMGFYPDNPADASYTLTSPTFDRATLRLDERYYPQQELVIETQRSTPEACYIDRVEIDGKRYSSFRITHQALVSAKRIVFFLTDRRTGR